MKDMKKKTTKIGATGGGSVGLEMGLSHVEPINAKRAAETVELSQRTKPQARDTVSAKD